MLLTYKKAVLSDRKGWVVKCRNCNHTLTQIHDKPKGALNEADKRGHSKELCNHIRKEGWYE